MPSWLAKRPLGGGGSQVPHRPRQATREPVLFAGGRLRVAIAGEPDTSRGSSLHVAPGEPDASCEYSRRVDALTYRPGHRTTKSGPNRRHPSTVAPSRPPRRAEIESEISR
jgi:hypothetical protein